MSCLPAPFRPRWRLPARRLAGLFLGGLFLAGLLMAWGAAVGQTLPASGAAPSPVVRSPAPDSATPIDPEALARLKAELVPMSAWATPGSTVVVAVRQEIASGWHTYWKNPGDSGGATTLDWTLPSGVTAGDIVWPLPSRQRLQGLVNYGYQGVVHLPTPIQVPADARPGQMLPLRVRALFLVCSDEMCIPDERTLSLDLPVRSPGAAAPLDPRHGHVVLAAVETAPRPAGISARLTPRDGRLVLSATGGPLTGLDPGSSYFFPATGGIIDHAAAQAGAFGPQGLTLTLTPGGTTLASGLASPVTGVLATSRGSWEITAEPGPPLDGVAGSGRLAPAGDASAPADGPVMGWPRAALFALVGGLILNLMPCVFPILAMKAAALAHVAHDRRAARVEAAAFLAGVLTTFLILGGVLLALRSAGEAAGWGFQLQSPPVTAGLALLMLGVALNLSGVFHVGAGVQRLGGGWTARLPPGLGAFCTGVLAVAVAAPCTAPFMALALGAALVMAWPLALLVFLMLGLGLALPFVAVALVPGVLARLPRPGPWMERLRGLLAFPMYAAALWLAWVFGRQTGSEGLGLLFVAGVILALALWLTGAGQAERAHGRRGLILSVAGIAAAAIGVAAAVLAARAPGEPAATTPGTAAIASRPWSAEAVEAALAQGRPVLVNLTADWCVTCKINERTSLSSPHVAEALEAAGAVYLVGDWTRRDDAITAELQRRGRSGVPLYLLHTPGETRPRVLPQLLTEGLVIDALQGARPPAS